MTFGPPLKGAPRPAGLDYAVRRLARGEASGPCGMLPMRICLAASAEEVQGVVVVTMSERGRKGRASVYLLCRACADAGGDLRGLETAALDELDPAPRSPRPPLLPGEGPLEDAFVWDAETAAAEE